MKKEKKKEKRNNTKRRKTNMQTKIEGVLHAEETDAPSFIGEETWCLCSYRYNQAGDDILNLKYTRQIYLKFRDH